MAHWAWASQVEAPQLDDHSDFGYVDWISGTAGSEERRSHRSNPAHGWRGSDGNFAQAVPWRDEITAHLVGSHMAIGSSWWTGGADQDPRPQLSLGGGFG
ncbi:hypothetical protein LA080_005099 [Diaporthe eres]|nr:hypothetical protein LA080_005099 [Diaporthe eres]